MSLIELYFKYTKELINTYGAQSVVLMEVGSFYEIYGMLDDNNKIIGSPIEEIALQCELIIAHKKSCVGKKQVVMAGFGNRDYILEKYIKKIQNIGYTVAVYNQDQKGSNTTRSLTNIISPGTYFTSDTQNISNNVSCIWVIGNKLNLIIGFSNIDIFTGKSFVYEYTEENVTKKSCFDDLERNLSIYNPNEVILIYEIDRIEILGNLKQLVNNHSQCIHMKDFKEGSKELINCEKQIYQLEILKHFFKMDDFTKIELFYQYEIACRSFCYLCNFIKLHNQHLLDKLHLPIFQTISERTNLGNDSLNQLNIINKINDGPLSSVEKFINKCLTTMGKRKLYYQITNPTTNIEFLEKEYNMIEYMIKKNMFLYFRDRLRNIKDIEKLNRKVLLKKITPHELYLLYSNFPEIIKCEQLIQEDEKMKTYFNDENILEKVEEVEKILDYYLEIEKCNNITSLDFDDNIIKQGCFPNHDKLVMSHIEIHDKIKAIQTYFNSILENIENKKNEYVKIHSTEKSGVTLQITERRCTILLEQLKKVKSPIKLKFISSYDQKNTSFSLSLENICKLKTGSVCSIESTEIKELRKQLIDKKNKMTDSLNIHYFQIIDEVKNHYENIETLVQFISKLDVIMCKTFISKKQNYCKPELDKKNKISHMVVEGLRHPLIEELLINETYKGNDIYFNESRIGMLLYGTNAVGKSSFIKSIGIAVIMAQAGFYVPCQSFTFYPYKQIFTRILGNDNIFKGLSSFAVEMIELKNILRLADESSLILGDELCSGTESSSAMAIFLSGIENLYKSNSHFIFATHIHEIINYEEITSKEKLQISHMSVVFDNETQELIYNRKLEDGAGTNNYGLEVCKSLFLPNEFLKKAYEIRNKYTNNKSILEYKKSAYNSKKIKGKCEMCGKEEIEIDVHHLQYQQDANNDGIIEKSFHKNHVANLLNVCNTCHDKIHKQKQRGKRIKTEKGYVVKTI